MSRGWRPVVRVFAVVAVSFVPSVWLVGRAQTPASQTGGRGGAWTAPRTPWGHPDLQGIWTGQQIAIPPMERPREFGNREFLTPEEIATRERAERDEFRRTIEAETGPRSVAEVSKAPAFEKGIVGEEYNNFWMERPKEPRRVWNRTSLVIDPPDGRIPPLTRDAVARLFAREEARRGRGEGDTWEDRNLNERCITTGNSLPGAVKQIIQTPHHVAIHHEAIGVFQVRIVPLDGRARLDDRIRHWTGDSRGRWEGETLVVETTNFNNKQDGGPIMPSRRPLNFYLGAGDTLKITERFTRTADDLLEYSYTVDDPRTYSRPYTVLRPLVKDDSYRMLEVACHEGNRGMEYILRASRTNEQATLEAAAGEAADRRPQLEALKKASEAVK
jgi:hypothetical protein